MTILVKCMRTVKLIVVFMAALWRTVPACAADPIIKEFPVAKGSLPHDVAPARDGGVWYTSE